MWTEVNRDTKQITDYLYRRVTIDLEHQDVRQEAIVCEDMDDFLGGIGRAFKLLGQYEVEEVLLGL
jgi:aldehyde:ferredoxin oxidoreductase